MIELRWKCKEHYHAVPTTPTTPGMPGSDYAAEKIKSRVLQYREITETHRMNWTDVPEVFE